MPLGPALAPGVRRKDQDVIRRGELIPGDRLMVAGIKTAGAPLAREPSVQIWIVVEMTAAEESGPVFFEDLDNVLPVQGFAGGRLVMEDEEWLPGFVRTFAGLGEHVLRG